MIDYVTGDLLAAGTEALVNSVNCVGVMGRGVALQFKRKFPGNFDAYRAACEAGDVRPGRMLVVATGVLIPRYIINFPTKRHWRGNSRLDDIESGLTALVAEIQGREIRSIALPALGCGLGGLQWSVVKPLIHAALRDLTSVDAVVFEPHIGTRTPGPACDLSALYVPGHTGPVSHETTQGQVESCRVARKDKPNALEEP